MSRDRALPNDQELQDFLDHLQARLVPKLMLWLEGVEPHVRRWIEDDERRKTPRFMPPE